MNPVTMDCNLMPDLGCMPDPVLSSLSSSSISSWSASNSSTSSLSTSSLSSSSSIAASVSSALSSLQATMSSPHPIRNEIFTNVSNCHRFPPSVNSIIVAYAVHDPISAILHTVRRENRDFNQAEIDFLRIHGPRAQSLDLRFTLQDTPSLQGTPSLPYPENRYPIVTFISSALNSLSNVIEIDASGTLFALFERGICDFQELNTLIVDNGICCLRCLREFRALQFLSLKNAIIFVDGPVCNIRTIAELRTILEQAFPQLRQCELQGVMLAMAGGEWSDSFFDTGDVAAPNSYAYLKPGLCRALV